MPDNNYPLYVSIASAIISLTSLSITLTKFRKEVSGRLKMLYHFSEDNSRIDIILMNISFRPVTLISYAILYAANEFYYQSIGEVDIDSSSKLTDSDTFKFAIVKNDLQELVKQKEIKQDYYHTLKLRIRTSNSGEFVFDITVPKEIIQGDYYEMAERFIATDIFLGFPKKESRYFPTGSNIVGLHK